MAPPLAGLKVLDFTALLPGPFATLLLADLGAEVVNIVAPHRPDAAAQMPPRPPGSEVGAAAAWLGRGKRSVALDLKHPAGPEAVRRLLQTHDVVMEQFRPGVMGRLGLGYAELAAQRPGLIYCSLTGYGQDGPLANRAGHDINYLSRSGLMSYSGRRGGGPAPLPLQAADVAAGGQNAVIAILAAVIHRQSTGRGQHLDISMTDGAYAFNAMAAASLLAGGPEPEPESLLLNGGSLYDFYRTADGRWLSFGGLEPKFSEAFLRALGLGDLAGQGVAPADAPAAKARVAAAVAARPLAHWREVFSGVDACVEPVLTLSEALADPHAAARGLVKEVELPGGGKVRQLACPLKLSATPPAEGAAGGRPGAHTREVLAEAGYGGEELDRLAAEGVFG
jgi:crotonobetainyl-CoA:carnitine CoA-transferase CaiB-like acyl-CoA transferase